MIPYLTISYGNASSIYSIGRKSKKAIDEASLLTAHKINGLWKIYRKSYATKDGDTVKYKYVDSERNPIYVGVASFITAYARQKLINAIDCNYNNFVFLALKRINRILFSLSILNCQYLNYT